MSDTRYPSMIIMGVQGSGKSTIGAALAQRLNIDFIDGDDLHPKANKDKMAGGTPLTDEDRGPWLDRVSRAIMNELDDGNRSVVACSALRRAYRDRLRAGVGRPIYFVHLVGDKSLLTDRLAHRDHEYMPSTLLDSQMETLEPLAEWEHGIAISVEQSPEAIVDEVTRILMARAAGRAIEPDAGTTLTGTIDIPRGGSTTAGTHAGGAQPA